MSRPSPPGNAAIVTGFLRGQNLEQVGRIDEAIAEYEVALGAAFDATGPYDRLIAIYGARAEHHEVIRVAEAALAYVRTHEEKRSWYAEMRAGAERALGNVPQARRK